MTAFASTASTLPVKSSGSSHARAGCGHNTEGPQGTDFVPAITSWQRFTKCGHIMARWPNLAKLGLAEGNCCGEWTSWKDVHAAASAFRSIPIPRDRFWSTEFRAHLGAHSLLQNLETTGSRDLQRASSQMNIRRPSARDLAIGMTDVASLHPYHKYIDCF